jgi:protein-S-isoprenylcysteine O-methyltransferase Ste14
MIAPLDVCQHPRLLPPCGLLLSLLAQFPLLWAEWPLQPTLVGTVVGTGLIAVGAGLNAWADRIFKAGQVGICPFSPAPVLLTHGPYRFTRNPMYLGLVAVTAGVTLLTGVLANLWIAVALWIWLHWGYVVAEERWLRDRFGTEFDAYADRVPQWLAKWPARYSSH